MSDISARGFSRSVQSRQRVVHMIASRVDGTGAASLLSGSQELTLTDNGVGDYTLTFAKPYSQVPVVMCSTLTANSVLQVSAVSVSACTIKAWQAADGVTAVDVDFHVLIVGSDAADEV